MKIRFLWLEPKEFGIRFNRKIRVFVVGLYWFCVAIAFGDGVERAMIESVYRKNIHREANKFLQKRAEARKKNRK